MADFKKVVYVWNEPQAAIDVPTRLTFRAVDDGSMETLVDAVALVMADSMDRHDQQEVKAHGAKETALAFIAEAKEYFTYELSWWQLAYDADGDLVGFVQPVAFPAKFRKDGLDESTIYYIGVLPEKRGNGYATDLLCQSTRILQEVGVWRIYCDTDEVNAPMISTFQRVGYQQQEGEEFA